MISWTSNSLSPGRSERSIASNPAAVMSTAFWMSAASFFDLTARIRSIRSVRSTMLTPTMRSHTFRKIDRSRVTDCTNVAEGIRHASVRALRAAALSMRGSPSLR